MQLRNCQLLIISCLGEQTFTFLRIMDDKEVGTISELAPGEKSKPFTAHHTVTEADIDHGHVDNIATAEANGPYGKALSAASEKVTVPVGRDIRMEVFKTTKRTKDLYEIGEKIEYLIEVRNTGDEELTDIKVTDDNADDKEVGTIDRLASGKHRTLAAWHTVTQADIYARYVYNLAKATVVLSASREVSVESTDPNPCANCPVDENCPNCTITPISREPIKAVPDLCKVESTKDGGTTGSVLENDLLEGLPVDPTKILLTPLMPSDPGLVMDPDGTISVSPDVKPGKHEYPYRICEVQNPGNCSEATATVDVLSDELTVPNVFKPNGDGVNDMFEIEGIDNFERVELSVFNRWGNEVYHAADYRNNWNGGVLNNGTYYYKVIAYKNGEAKVSNGWILVME